jgi:cytochrome c oxidase accessory protein FixG
VNSVTTTPPGVDAAGEGYFARHVKVRPKIVHGRWARLRAATLCLTLGVLYVAPWLRWDGRQAILLDLPQRKFHLFALVLWPQDLIYLTALLVSAALLLFLLTSLFGRVWCGYACPQTVFTQIMVWLERLFEGDRGQQLRLAERSWSLGKTSRKLAKWSAGISVAAASAFSAVALFVPAPDLATRLLAGTLGGWEILFLVGFSGVILLFAAKMREQVCTYMCPYARFQSAMFDRDTWIVSYDAARGEPRGARRPAQRPPGLGDCVDCKLCVQVCPTGIDIRDGLQYQCIACTSCIDACDGVMDRIGSPRGLVRYTTQNALDGVSTQTWRPRPWIFGGALIALGGFLAAALAARVPLALDVLRDRNAAYRETTEGRIENVYRLKVLNMDRVAHRYAVGASGLPSLAVATTDGPIEVSAGEVRDVVVRISVDPRALARRSTPIQIHLEAEDDRSLSVREAARFVGPRLENVPR